MIKVSVLYPTQPDAKFDLHYYLNKHIPLVKETVGPALKNVSVSHGISGGAPGSAAPYVCICELYFDSVEAFQQSFVPHGRALTADVKNCTNIRSVVQIAEVDL